MPEDLFAQFISFSNLHQAFQKAKKLKNLRPEVLQFEYFLEENLLTLKKELEAGTYCHGGYHSFMVYDPKMREIKAAPFRDRVVHHALCNVIEPIFDQGFIFDSYACRQGKGVHRALQRLKKFLQSIHCIERERERDGWPFFLENLPRVYCLKCDIRKYFASIDQEILLGIIRKKIFDKKILEILEKIVVSSYDQIVWENLLETRKTGIPIGNLTSQLFANIYLNELDQFVKHQLKIRHYLRYMDDFLFLGGDKKELRKIKEKVEIFLRESLRLHFHPKKANLFPVKNGIDFLGYRVFYPTLVKLRKKTVQRFCGKMKQRKKSGDAKKLFQSVQSFLGFAKHARAWGLVGRLGIGVEK